MRDDDVSENGGSNNYCLTGEMHDFSPFFIGTTNTDKNQAC
jgi:hypothetical protein